MSGHSDVHCVLGACYLSTANTHSLPTVLVLVYASMLQHFLIHAAKALCALKPIVNCAIFIFIAYTLAGHPRNPAKLVYLFHLI